MPDSWFLVCTKKTTLSWTYAITWNQLSLNLSTSDFRVCLLSLWRRQCSLFSFLSRLPILPLLSPHPLRLTFKLFSWTNVNWMSLSAFVILFWIFWTQQPVLWLKSKKQMSQMEPCRTLCITSPAHCFNFFDYSIFPSALPVFSYSYFLLLLSYDLRTFKANLHHHGSHELVFSRLRCPANQWMDFVRGKHFSSKVTEWWCLYVHLW